MNVVGNIVRRSSFLLSRDGISRQNQLPVSHWKIPSLPIRAEGSSRKKMLFPPTWDDLEGRREDQGYVKVKDLSLR